MAYSDKVLDHYENPRNVGSMDKEDTKVGTGMVGAPACGDVMKLQIKVNDDGIIEDAKFKTYGCGSAIASSSLLTEWVKGKSLTEASLIKNSSLNKIHLKNLDNKGFIILENVNYMKKNLHKLKKKSKILINLEKEKGGWEGKEQYYKKGKKFESGADRLGSLVSKGNEFLGLIKIPEIIHAAKHVTKKEIKVCGLNLRNPKKKQGKQMQNKSTKNLEYLNGKNVI